MIKILHFITDKNVGGAGRLLCSQIKNMRDEEFAITIALPRGSKLKKPLSSLPCTIIELEHGADCSFCVSGIFEAMKIIKGVHPDIVHSHGSLSSRIAATTLGIPSRVFTRHCYFPLSKIYKNPLSRMVVGLISNSLSTSMIAVAGSAKQNLIDMGCNKRKISTVINGVEPIRITSPEEIDYLNSRYGLTKNNFIISIIARLEECKGHKTFLQAAQICKKHYPNFRFFIVGDGSQKNYLKQLSHKLDIDDIVHFAGFCEDVSPILNITDVNVNCSVGTETSCLALSEGMSLGIPSVASDYGGNTHMVKNTVNGLIFPAGNAEALAMALIRLYRDEELYAKCSLGALRRFHEEFNAAIMTKKMADFYKVEYLRHKK